MHVTVTVTIGEERRKKYSVIDSETEHWSVIFFQFRLFLFVWIRVMNSSGLSPLRKCFHGNSNVSIVGEAHTRPRVHERRTHVSKHLSYLLTEFYLPDRFASKSFSNFIGVVVAEISVNIIIFNFCHPFRFVSTPTSSSSPSSICKQTFFSSLHLHSTCEFVVVGGQLFRWLHPSQSQ